MMWNQTKWANLCEDLNKGGNLLISYEVCPFKYFCSCFSCPMFNDYNCDIKCNNTGKVQILGAKNKYGCPDCQCKCSNPNCANTCGGYGFKTVTNRFNCTECECFCPQLDCDVHCEGKGLGIFGPKNDRGCFTECNGCKQKTGKYLNSLSVVKLFELDLFYQYLTQI